MSEKRWFSQQCHWNKRVLRYILILKNLDILTMYFEETVNIFYKKPENTNNYLKYRIFF